MKICYDINTFDSHLLIIIYDYCNRIEVYEIIIVVTANLHVELFTMTSDKVFL